MRHKQSIIYVLLILLFNCLLAFSGWEGTVFRGGSHDHYRFTEAVLGIFGFIPFGLTLLAYRYKRKGNPHPRLLLFSVIHFTLVIVYFGADLYNPLHSKARYFWLSAFCFLQLLLCCLYFIRQFKIRALVVLAFVGYYIIQAFVTPKILSFEYYTYIDNDPLPDDKALYIERLDQSAFKLEDGRVFVGNDMTTLSLGKKIIIEPHGNEGDPAYFLVSSKRNIIENNSIVSNVLYVIPIFENEISMNDLWKNGSVRLKTPAWKPTPQRVCKAINNTWCNEDWIISLLDQGVDPNYVKRDHRSKWTMLLGAARWGHEKVAQHLIKLGANVDYKSSYGSTPLHYSAVKSFAITKSLLENGADILFRDQGGHTPLDALVYDEFKGQNPNDIPKIKALLESAFNKLSKEDIALAEEYYQIKSNLKKAKNNVYSKSISLSASISNFHGWCNDESTIDKNNLRKYRDTVKEMMACQNHYVHSSVSNPTNTTIAELRKKFEISRNANLRILKEFKLSEKTRKSHIYIKDDFEEFDNALKYLGKALTTFEKYDSKYR